ncbi:MAG TPA: NAD-dependent succinate-semialdehyde dehydrogenase [Symbiobacteriaceae bacterium]|nr:NAD-dependent succinate-semialdehyde dehydrogenase [Symbiobacteriaceae bacterium]
MTVNEDLIRGPYHLYVNGEWLDGPHGATFLVHNPATGAEVGRAPQAGRAATRAAIAAAASAFPAWAARSAHDRAALLQRVRDLILSNTEPLARLITLEMGKPIREARAEVYHAAEVTQWYAEEGKRVYGETVPAHVPNKRILVIKQPVGVAGVITPWNFPFSILARKVATALAAGCTVVAKPAEQTPLTGIVLARLYAMAGFPRGAFNLVTGDPVEIGAELLQSEAVRKITFTGSTEVGKLLMRRGADQVKRLSLELGGHAPFIVFADADLDLAVAGLMATKFRNAGQTCSCANRVFVERSVLEPFTARLQEAMGRLRVGNGLDESTDLGPIIDARGMAKLVQQVEDARAKGAVVYGGTPFGGDPPRFFPPTLLTQVSTDMLVCREETFGPIVPLIAFDMDAEAVHMANDSRYGLVAYYYTRDLNRAIRVGEALEYGVIGVNDAMPTVAHAPFGGLKESGVGKEGGWQGLEEFLESKYLSIGLDR